MKTKQKQKKNKLVNTLLITEILYPVHTSYIRKCYTPERT
jgi:hypothetical protein